MKNLNRLSLLFFKSLLFFNVLFLFGFVIGLGLLGCTPQSTEEKIFIQSQDILNASFNSSSDRKFLKPDAGYIVKIERKDATILKSRWPDQLKTISSSRGLYKIANETKESILREIPSARVIPDYKLSMPSQLKHHNSQIPLLIDFLAQLGTQVPLIKGGLPCQAKQPLNRNLALELIESDTKMSVQSVLGIGLNLRLRVREKDPGTVEEINKNTKEKNQKTLHFAWFVIEPRSNQILGPLSYDEKFSFLFTEIGAYQIAVLVQDNNQACQILHSPFVISANPEFFKLTHFPAPPKLEDFFHLTQIEVQKAWNVTQGEGQTIAILDTGINYLHPYLNENILMNPKEVPNNNIDDDNNGYIDDVIGWDFGNKDPWPFDDDGHGSFVAGLAAGKTFGVAPKASILPVKVLNGFGEGNLSDLLSGFYYAMDRGAKVINVSLVVNDFPEIEVLFKELFSEDAKKNAVSIVWASGNDHLDCGRGWGKFLSFAFFYKNVISVAAVDEFSKLTDYSNYGVNCVKVAAPGGILEKPLISTSLQNSKGRLFIEQFGTSVAAPLVSGTIALMKAANPQLTVEDISEILLKSGTPDPSLIDKVYSGRVINAAKAVDLAKSLQQQKK